MLGIYQPDQLDRKVDYRTKLTVTVHQYPYSILLLTGKVRPTRCLWPLLILNQPFDDLSYPS